MPDGIQKEYGSTDSSAPLDPFLLFRPTNFREVIQKQINVSVDQASDRIQDFSFGHFDGRLFSNVPGETQPMENAHGRFYHIVGVSVGGDLSVAAP
jgi:hypothetical protein